jgi:hypothetical protein
MGLTSIALAGWFLAGVFMLKSYRSDLDAKYERRRFASMMDSELRKHRAAVKALPR